MRFLKKKIEGKHKALLDEEKLPNKETQIKLEETNSEDQHQEFPLPMRKPRQKRSHPEGDSKNIIKNYGKALCSFASSSMAIPYLETTISKRGYKNVNIKEFMAYIKVKKESINSIESIRRLLIVSQEDDTINAAYKSIFQDISIIFLKYFAVNWIYNGKLMHKSAHLKFRFKMLRRIQNPEHFTYLKTSVK